MGALGDEALPLVDELPLLLPEVLHELSHEVALSLGVELLPLPLELLLLLLVVHQVFAALTNNTHHHHQHPPKRREPCVERVIKALSHLHRESLVCVRSDLYFW